MRTMRMWGLISALGLFSVIVACGSSGETETVEPAEPAAEGDPFGLVEALNNDLAAASEEIGENVEAAEGDLDEASDQAGEATDQAEEAMDEATEQLNEPAAE